MVNRYRCNFVEKRKFAWFFRFVPYGHTIGAIQRALATMPPGSVFGVSDFYGHGTAAAVESALRTLLRKGVIAKAARGRYCLPVISKLTGNLLPATAQRLAKSYLDEYGREVPLLPTGAAAANMLGLSLQVPMRQIYLSPRRIRLVQLPCGQKIEFTPVCSRRMAVAPRISGLVFEALRWLGKKEAASPKTRRHLRLILSANDKATLAADLRFAPAWMCAILLPVITPD